MTYIKPGDVVSPKAHWKLIAVLRDGGPGEIAYAVGEWNGVPGIGMRWNGTDNKPIGNPQSRGLPTWTMLDPEIHLAVIQQLPDERKQVLACEHLGIDVPPMIEIEVRHHMGSGCHTLMKRASGQRMPEDSKKRLLGNPDRADFLAALYEDLRVHLGAGTRVVLHDLPG